MPRSPRKINSDIYEYYAADDAVGNAISWNEFQDPRNMSALVGSMRLSVMLELTEQEHNELTNMSQVEALNFLNARYELHVYRFSERTPDLPVVPIVWRNPRTDESLDIVILTTLNMRTAMLVMW
jgi:hypothetical protein